MELSQLLSGGQFHRARNKHVQLTSHTPFPSKHNPFNFRFLLCNTALVVRKIKKIKPHNELGKIEKNEELPIGPCVLLYRAC